MEIQLNKVWEQCLEIIKTELTDVSFNTWIKTIEPLTVMDDIAILCVPNDFTKGILESRYTTLVANAIKEVTSKPYEVKFIMKSERGDYIDEAKEESSGLKTVPMLNPKYTFDTFVIGNSNRFAHAASLAVSEAPAQAYNPLFIYGGVGLGKTHLMHAIGDYILSQSTELEVLYVTSEKFTNELINSIKDDKNEDFRSRYRNIDVLLIDDIQFIAGKERTQEEFFHTFNSLYEANKQIIISSDRTPKEIPTLEDRLRSRFEWGLIADIQPPDLETRVAILKKKAELEGVEIPNDVLLFIANRIESNIRELEGALIRILAYSSLTNNKLNVRVAEEALRDIVSDNKPRPITCKLIQEVVAGHFNLRVEDFKSKKRHRPIAYPRQIAMFLTRELTEMSLPKIGENFGGRDHTTVIHACDKIANEIEEDSQVRAMIEELTTKIRK